MLLAATAASIDGAEQMAGALSKQGLYFICGCEAAVIVFLASALGYQFYARIRDAQTLAREGIQAIDQNTNAMGRFARALEAKWPRAKRPPVEEVDAVEKLEAGGP